MQIAFEAHVPEQGFVHLFLEHTLSNAQSMLVTHSGLHPTYGSPLYSDRQVQIPFEHKALYPHGDGLHGSSGASTTTKHSIYNTRYEK